MKTTDLSAGVSGNGAAAEVLPDFSLFPPENPALFFKLMSYLLVIGGITPAITIFMNVLNRTRITGRENLRGLRHRWILASNHLTLLDDLFIGPLLIFPNSLKGYKYFPFHAPEQRNFYKTPWIRWFMRQCKSVPIVRGRGVNQEGINYLIKAMKQGGILHIFPEGTRTRTGALGQGQPGVGRIVCESGAPVVPMYHQGLERVLPIGSGVPRIGNEIRISIGKPLRFQPEIQTGKESLVWREVSSQIIEAIRCQKEIAEKTWGEKPLIVNNINKL